MSRHRKDRIGKKYGKLTLLEYTGPHPRGRGALWRASCECGREREVLASDVATGRVRTCGKCRTRLGIPTGKAVSTQGIPKGSKGAFRRAVSEWRDVQPGVDFPTRGWIEQRNKQCGVCGSGGPGTWAFPLYMPSTSQTLGGWKLIPLCPICDGISRSKRGTFLSWLSLVISRAMGLGFNSK